MGRFLRILKIGSMVLEIIERYYGAVKVKNIPLDELLDLIERVLTSDKSVRTASLS